MNSNIRLYINSLQKVKLGTVFRLKSERSTKQVLTNGDEKECQREDADFTYSGSVSK